MWERRYRVLGPSAVWDGFHVCKVLSGPEAGKTVVLDEREFAGMAPARRRKAERV